MMAAEERKIIFCGKFLAGDLVVAEAPELGPHIYYWTLTHPDSEHAGKFIANEKQEPFEIVSKLCDGITKIYIQSTLEEKNEQVASGAKLH